jgi:hypothetical protein
MAMQSNTQVNEYRFFHYTPIDDNFYHVTCKIILQGSAPLDDYDYDHGFFYRCLNNPAANYYVTCKLFSHSLIANLLNRKVYGMDINVDNLKQNELLPLDQKLNLEQDLKRILHFHLTQNHIFEREMRPCSVNSFRGYNNITTMQATSMTYGQNNFDDNGLSQNGAGGYIHDIPNQQQQVNVSQSNFDNGLSHQTGNGRYVSVSPQQQIDSPQYVPESGLPHLNRTHNIQQQVGIPQSNFDNGLPHQNGMSRHVTSPQQQADAPNGTHNVTISQEQVNFPQSNFDNDLSHQNGTGEYVTSPQQQVDIPQYVEMRPDYNRSSGNIRDNVITTQDSMFDSTNNFNNVLPSHQGGNERNNAYPQRVPERENTNSFPRTMDNMMTTTTDIDNDNDHQDTNGIDRIVYQQQQVSQNNNDNDQDINIV